MKCCSRRGRRLAVAVVMMIATGAWADDAQNPFARDLLMITDWFEGEFDNSEQLWFHRRSGARGEAPTRIHASHHRIDAPAFGNHVFYVEEYLNDDPQEVYRQRLVTFESDIENDAIRIKQGFFNKPEAWLGAHEDPARFTGLKPGDVTFIDTCDVFMRREADQFRGGMQPKACVFGEGDERRYAVHNLVISETKYWRDDTTFLVSDDSFFRGTPPGQPSELRKANRYFCDFYFYDGDGGQQVVEGLPVHDQGGSGQAVRESDEQAFQILLRQKEYPYYEARPDFLYYSIRRVGEERSVAFGVADPRSRQFGLNNGDLAAFCHRDGYRFREPIETL